MGQEIEHKYLVIDDSFKDTATECHHIIQGYLSRVPERTVRVRVRDEQGFITVKGKNTGDKRLEFEYEIPVDDAHALMSLCEGKIIDKTRYIVPFEGYIWEVDCFKQPQGLSIAEIELPSSVAIYSKPPFAGENVTGVPEFYNSNL